MVKRTGSNEPICQPVLKETGWIEDFNLSARSYPFRPARNLDGLKYRPTRHGPLARLKKK